MPVPQTAPPPVVEAPAALENPPVVSPPVARRVTIPANTAIAVRTIDSVDSRTDQVGQTFRASIDSDIIVDARKYLRDNNVPLNDGKIHHMVDSTVEAYYLKSQVFHSAL